MADLTRILARIEQGEPQAAEQLLPLVYDELRKLAAAKLAQEKPGQTLQATALVHEAYIRLVGGERSEVRDQKSDEHKPTSDLRPLTSDRWHSRGHFFAAAAEAMRRILVDQARAKASQKRGGDRQRLDLDQIDLAKTPVGEELLAFNDVLEALQAQDAEAGQLVQLRYFAGLSVEEAAQAMNIPRSTAYDHWTFARAWLRCRLRDENR